MELLFVVLAGIILGLAARYLFPLRETHGAFLIPAIGAVTASVVWEALTWLGWAWNGGWIWTTTLLLTAAVVSVSAVTIGRSRRSRDRAQLSALLSPKARAV
ncbi:hypothetical protein KPL76_13455 [Subtercola sp. PAMC28395]|uniref:hypothetical protein n=1 Tax=Subtercola sp. PAMC28395 TaxID=2846775 RepID=UPI001C0DD1DF|nr:hypothetical protein [Subtercola sp. PAMC28395]QWT23680.1 hypothetical protein KPL76_13455 [Subtercola sp. PAMC28395]